LDKFSDFPLFNEEFDNVQGNLINEKIFGLIHTKENDFLLIRNLIGLWHHNYEHEAASCKDM
jgi:hypothetical protein